MRFALGCVLVTVSACGSAAGTGSGGASGSGGGSTGGGTFLDGGTGGTGGGTSVDGSTGGGAFVDGGTGDAPTNTVDAGSAPSKATLVLTLTADLGAAANAVVSLGVPFPPGVLSDTAQLRVRDASGAEVAIMATSLATWPLDASHRSVLVAFRTTLATGVSAAWSLDYGTARTQNASGLVANPDGPVVATLPADWYFTSRVIGFGVSAARNTVFPAWGTEIDRQLTGMNPAWTTYGLSCETTANERTYYDGPHALFQRFTYRASASAYRRAREEAKWYRANELNWFSARSIALYACDTTWNASTSLSSGSVRRMLGQGMLDDYLISGDPAALEALKGLGEAFRQNLPALMGGNRPTLKLTERNMAWPMMGLASYYAVEQTTQVRDALDQLIGLTVAWQSATPSGAFEHDIMLADPSECGDGPAGGSPFMTSLLVDGLVDAWRMRGDPRIPPAVVKAARWMKDSAVTTDGAAFQYLWNCRDTDYRADSLPDLNLLIAHVFGAAFYFTDDESWLTFGDTMAGHGLDAIYAGRPKQWSQATRGFLKYLGYRSLKRSP